MMLTWWIWAACPGSLARIKCTICQRIIQNKSRKSFLKILRSGMPQHHKVSKAFSKRHPFSTLSCLIKGRKPSDRSIKICPSPFPNRWRIQTSVSIDSSINWLRCELPRCSSPGKSNDHKSRVPKRLKQEGLMRKSCRSVPWIRLSSVVARSRGLPYLDLI